MKKCIIMFTVFLIVLGVAVIYNEDSNVTSMKSELSLDESGPVVSAWENHKK